METFATRALLLGQVDTGEADRVVTLLTEDAGKVAAIARGARRSRKRFGAALSLFVLARADLQPRRTSDLHVLAAYEALHVFGGIGKALGAIAHGSYATEVVGALCPEGQPEPTLFELLLEMYAYLDTGPPRSQVLRAFELRVLTAAGHGPQLGACVRCGLAGLSPGHGLGFDVARGGLLCHGCCLPSEEISGEALSQLARLSGAPLGEPGPDPPAEVAAELRSALTGSVLEAVGRPLRSIEFIRKMSS